MTRQPTIAELIDWQANSYAQVRAAVDRAAAGLAPVALPDWAGWIVYLLEALEVQAAGRGDFDAMLESVETAIAIRRAGGRW
jgi:hypothetical protein